MQRQAPFAFAAGVEAAASTERAVDATSDGGEVRLSWRLARKIPYVDIITVSFLPALIYFCLWHFSYVLKQNVVGVQKVTSGCEPLLKGIAVGLAQP